MVANVNSPNVCESGFFQYCAEMQNGNKYILQIELFIVKMSYIILLLFAWYLGDFLYDFI